VADEVNGGGGSMSWQLVTGLEIKSSDFDLDPEQFKEMVDRKVEQMREQIMKAYEGWKGAA